MKNIKKNGFVSSSIIYAFFIVFLLLLVYLLSNYSNIRFLLDRINYGIRNGAMNQAVGDINMYIYIWDEEEETYNLKNNVSPIGYDIVESSCTNDATVGFKDGKIVVKATKKTVCNVYFRKTKGDIILNVYTKESSKAARKIASKIPDSNYLFTSVECKDNEGNLVENVMMWNEATRQFDVKTNKRIECTAVFTKKEQLVNITYYIEDASGNSTFEEFKYSKTNGYPSDAYTFYKADCENGTQITFDSANGKLTYNETQKDTCKVYFRGGSKKVNMLYKKESTTGDPGYTEGKLYIDTVNVPKTGFQYVGYKCNGDGAINLVNGVLTGTSSSQDTCTIYFDAVTTNADISYYVQDTTNNYVAVSSVPSTGYKYNQSKSNCTNGSTIQIINNVAYVNANDTCSVYFDVE